MASNKSAVSMLVGKLPPPDKLDDMDTEDQTEPKEDEDEGGDEAAKLSAFEDLLAALGLSTKKAEAGMKAFDHFMDLCGHSEHEDTDSEDATGDEA